jgi:predicted ester cyclase
MEKGLDGHPFKSFQLVMALSQIYQQYIRCLNDQSWGNLGQFVSEDVQHNGRRLGLSRYRMMLERDFAGIPDLFFHMEMLVGDLPFVGAWLAFQCSPQGVFLGLPVHGKRVHFAENVFYAFRQGRIAEVWSIIDKRAIEAQL